MRTAPYWRVGALPQRVPRRVLMLPGVRYSCERPLLSWCAAIAHQHGWWVQQAWWSLGPESNNESVVGRALDLLDAQAPDAAHTLVIAKSMGTRAGATASERGWDGIWLTPLLEDVGVREALVGYRGNCLLVGGGADHHWTPPPGRVDELFGVPGGLASSGPAEKPAHPLYACAAADRRAQRWVQVDGANHSLEVPGDWRASLAVQRTVLEIVDRFVATIEI
ncbi:hypothetical protein [Propionibacterium cyclohexanicum]|nr:hypothetical protein [Propionibacterium cyclohexanicum]